MTAEDRREPPADVSWVTFDRVSDGGAPGIFLAFGVLGAAVIFFAVLLMFAAHQGARTRAMQHACYSRGLHYWQDRNVCVQYVKVTP